MSDYLPFQVRQAREDLEEFIEKQPRNERGHLVFKTYADAVGLQVLQRDYTAARELSLVKGDDVDLQPETKIIPLPIRDKEVA